MPELPEVETIIRNLRRGCLQDGSAGVSLIGQTVHSAHLFWNRSLSSPSAAEFLQRLPGQTVNDLTRRGKFLVFGLSQDYLLIHLRMSGDLRLETAGESPALRKHDRLVLVFESGLRLIFHDPRKFGRIWLVQDPATVLGGLGPEPLDEDFTVESLYDRLQARRRALKPLLLDQSFLAGLGNIYTDEALHLAGLHPNRISSSISREESGRLWNAIRTVLEEGIRRNGASIDWVYRGGEYQNHFRVYGRAGEACSVCGTPVQRLVVGQRGTYICPHCQPF